ncbi:MAG: response regulator [Alphaproteobacteria bacterium]|nr:response regulator [Alphaproteobacteria bacterium]
MPAIELLIAEDDDLNRAIVLGLLRGLDIEPVPARDGAEALRLFAERRFDAVLMDLRMPVMDGVAAIKAIRAAEAQDGRAPVPIAALSAGFDSDRRAALEAGANLFLPKGLSRAELAAALRFMLGERVTAPPPIDSPLSPLLPAFRRSLADSIATMRRLLAENARESLAAEAHRARGQCAVFGYPGLEGLLAGLEEGASADTADLLDEIAQALARLMPAPQ